MTGQGWRALRKNRPAWTDTLTTHGWTPSDVDALETITGKGFNRLQGAVAKIVAEGTFPDRSPRVVLAWMRLVSDRGLKLDAQVMTVWHGVLGPGLTAPASFAAGLTLAEAVAQRDAGVLDEASVLALAALRGQVL